MEVSISDSLFYFSNICDVDDFCIDVLCITAMSHMPKNTARSARLFKENYLLNRSKPVRFD